MGVFWHVWQKVAESEICIIICKERGERKKEGKKEKKRERERERDRERERGLRRDNAEGGLKKHPLPLSVFF